MRSLFLISFILMFLLAPVSAWASIAADLLNLQSDLNVIKGLISIKPSMRNPKSVSPPKLDEEHQQFIELENEKLLTLKTIDISTMANTLIEKGVGESSFLDNIYDLLRVLVVPTVTREEFKQLINAISSKYGVYDRILITNFRRNVTKIVEEVRDDFYQKSDLLTGLKRADKEFNDRVKEFNERGPVDLMSKQDLISAVLPAAIRAKEFEEAGKNEFSDPQYPEPTRRLLTELSQKINKVWEEKTKKTLTKSDDKSVDASRESIEKTIESIRADIKSAFMMHVLKENFFLKHPNKYGIYPVLNSLKRSILEKINPKLPSTIQSEFLKDEPHFMQLGLSKQNITLLDNLSKILVELNHVMQVELGS
jgi:hypothetical protein